MNLLDSIFWFLNFAFLGYACSTAIFLVLGSGLDWFRSRSDKYLNISNFLILIIVAVNIAVSIFETHQCLSEKKASASEVEFGFTESALMDSCYWSILWTAVFGFAFQLLFFKKRLRINKWISFISALLIWMLLSFEQVVVVYTSLFRDYLPSSWSTYYKGPTDFTGVIFTFLYFSLCICFSSIGKSRV